MQESYTNIYSELKPILGAAQDFHRCDLPTSLSKGYINSPTALRTALFH